MNYIIKKKNNIIELDEYIKNESFTLQNPDYQLWTNDQWLIDYIANKYDLTII